MSMPGVPSGGFQTVGQLVGTNQLFYGAGQDCLAIALDLLATHTSGAPVVDGKGKFIGFISLKTDLNRYKNLAATLELIRHFETDLYANAVIHIALAHRYTAISAVPGGKVLDVLSKKEFQK
jgi:hypothetical protein